MKKKIKKQALGLLALVVVMAVADVYKRQEQERE